ncbi:polysaccharide biosynthesis C-terminal domain-containing protein [Bacillus sp. 165]|uniref:oligosaccharide flippase family protein n=1 Tax=Bacillus sp. 165 TaxID=1529117 RepID=UPI001ADB01DE|nr:polysaccharide biosynthesis C-terminal domain-containing protein [Bacillus sp. 165]MBO9130022.1 polysaccharide biosynthesis C-terminal domain-containing protein [Bacillus sp. 165]
MYNSRILKKFNIFRKSNGNLFSVFKSILTNGFVTLLGLVTGMITARYLGVEGRGEQAAIIIWPQFLAYILTLGLPSALVYYFRIRKNMNAAYFYCSIISSLILGVISVIGGIIIVPFFLRGYSEDIILFSQIVMIAAPFILNDALINAILQGRGQFNTLNRVRYLTPFFTLVLLVFFIVTGTNNSYTFALAYLIPSIPITIYNSIRMYKEYKIPSWKELKKATQELYGYGIRSYGIDLAGAINVRLDRFLVVGLLSPKNMGLYVVALSLSRMLNIFTTGIVTVLFPKASGKQEKEIVEIIGRSARLNLFFTGVGALIIILFGPYALNLLYGKDFLDALPAFRILILEVMITGTVEILSQAFMALNKPGRVTIRQMIGLVINLPLLLILVPKYGINGAAVSLLISSIFRLLFILISFKKVLKVETPSLLINIKDFRWLKNTVNKKYKIA